MSAGQTFAQSDGVAVYGGELYVDDIVIDVRARSVDRHGGAEWTPGAASWPSGGLPKDVAVYNHYDHLGNLAVRTDAAGAGVATWTYDAFGNVIATTGTATAANYRHTGNHYDPDAQLFYFKNRWYDARLGRFTQRHTPYQPLSEHPYAISEGNPVAWSDPIGLVPPGYGGGWNPFGMGVLEGWDSFKTGLHDTFTWTGGTRAEFGPRMYPMGDLLADYARYAGSHPNAGTKGWVVNVGQLLNLQWFGTFQACGGVAWDIYDNVIKNNPRYRHIAVKRIVTIGTNTWYHTAVYVHSPYHNQFDNGGFVLELWRTGRPTVHHYGDMFDFWSGQFIGYTWLESFE